MRSFRRQPGFPLVAILTLTLGISANTSYLPGASPTTRCGGLAGTAGQSQRHASELASPV